jgi:hypothetical protein
MMWLYPRPGCLDRPSSKELSAADVNAWIHKVLDLRANSNLGVDPTLLQEGVAVSRVSMFGPILAAYVILSFHCARGLVQCRCFLHRQDTGWLRSHIPILRWSYELQSTL